MDEIIIPPALHSAVGGITLLVALAATIFAWVGQRQNTQSTAGKLSLIALQIMLMLQTAVGIKLLDQNMGVMQKYIHYLGGLGAIGLIMLCYWLPKRTPAHTARQAAWLTTASFSFVIMSFFIGQYYVRSQFAS